ncbi:protein-tyrosine phosphatase [Mycoplana sp. BE70]|uniref:phosphatase domain-containing putative toxin n=1 Tax=Mycoplana sp. BE70 TaxID=2817775 RepID=UPI002860084A|nr:protein-tyrosine phosphatase family protein [Mycoplana sp. BE70]MDR6757422.1 protein-tyrosine phosphatase [Mycoplana sp. BE70]
MDTPEKFTIATVKLPNGGRIGLSRIPGRTGEYASDLQAIADWGADAVISMTDRVEMEARGCSDLGARLAERDIAWFHLPIRDFGGPSGTAEAHWPEYSAKLHEILDRGGAVLAHCHGGHGRAGMVALRLLVERGEEPDMALRQIRTVRPGAVQTDGQYRWAASATAKPRP